MMSAKEARKHFDKIINQQTDKDTIARLELCREFFTNEQFRKALADYIYAQNQ